MERMPIPEGEARPMTIKPGNYGLGIWFTAIILKGRPMGDLLQQVWREEEDPPGQWRFVRRRAWYNSLRSFDPEDFREGVQGLMKCDSEEEALRQWDDSFMATINDLESKMPEPLRPVVTLETERVYIRDDLWDWFSRSKRLNLLPSFMRVKESTADHMEAKRADIRVDNGSG